MNTLPPIQFKSIPNKEQRYPTVGDYFADGDTIQFRVSDMDKRYQLLVLIHELFEWFSISEKGIPIDKIDDFDIKFEQLRKAFPWIIGDQEPGHMISAPYHMDHVDAEEIEKLVAKKLKVDWDEYNNYLDTLE